MEPSLRGHSTFIYANKCARVSLQYSLRSKNILYRRKHQLCAHRFNAFIQLHGYHIAILLISESARSAQSGSVRGRRRGCWSVLAHFGFRFSLSFRRENIYLVCWDSRKLLQCRLFRDGKHQAEMETCGVVFNGELTIRCGVEQRRTRYVLGHVGPVHT